MRAGRERRRVRADGARREVDECIFWCIVESNV
jgi:hypothetical protein